MSETPKTSELAPGIRLAAEILSLDVEEKRTALYVLLRDPELFPDGPTPGKIQEQVLDYFSPDMEWFSSPEGQEWIEDSKRRASDFGWEENIE